MTQAILSGLKKAAQQLMEEHHITFHSLSEKNILKSILGAAALCLNKSSVPFCGDKN